MVKTISGEIVGSQRLTDMVSKAGLKGLTFGGIRDKGTKATVAKEWRQLVFHEPYVPVAPETKTGNHPFDLDAKGEHRCPRGHLLGLNLLSEVQLLARSRDIPDFALTREFVGVRRGLLRPERIMIVSARAREVLSESQIKGLEFEIAAMRCLDADVR